MTRRPAATSGLANSAATPCGSARKTNRAPRGDDLVHVALDERERPRSACPANFGKTVRERLPRELARSERDEFHARMPDEQPHEFLAGISAGADDGDFFEIHGGAAYGAARR